MLHLREAGRRGFQYTYRGLAKYKGGVGVKVTGKTKRKFRPNLQRVRAVVGGNVPARPRLHSLPQERQGAEALAEAKRLRWPARPEAAPGPRADGVRRQRWRAPRRGRPRPPRPAPAGMQGAASAMAIQVTDDLVRHIAGLSRLAISRPRTARAQEALREDPRLHRRASRTSTRRTSTLDLLGRGLRTSTARTTSRPSLTRSRSSRTRPRSRRRPTSWCRASSGGVEGRSRDPRRRSRSGDAVRAGGAQGRGGGSLAAPRRSRRWIRSSRPPPQVFAEEALEPRRGDRPPASPGRGSRAPRRRALHGEGHHLHPAREDHRGKPHPRELPRALRRDRRRAPRRAPARCCVGEDEHGRVRHGLVDRELGLLPDPEPVGPERTSPAARAAARRRWRPRRAA